MPTKRTVTVDQYLDALESDQIRAALRRLRSVIKSTIPDAEECIAYGIPSYRSGKFIVSFGGFKHHASFFPGHTVADFADQLTEFKILKGTIQFKPDRPIPDDLVRAIVRERWNEYFPDNQI
jgi:uncharacterized protein YdhG (YjbR/CyaY superfamily)